MLSVPYKRQHNRPFHTAEDDVCVCWRSLFLTVLHFRAQVCRGHKNPNFPHHPQPKTKQKKTGEKGKKNKNEKTKTPYGALYANYVQCLFILKLVGK